MEFVAAILFLILYFVRPHDWIPSIAGWNIVKPVIAMGLAGLAIRGARVPKWGWMNTPHEWIMACYFARAIYMDADWIGTLTTVSSFIAFFFLTAQALNDESRLERFFSWWAACVIFMCAVGVAADFGIDLTNAKELIDGQMGRLCLNTWLLDNPNALGHMAVTAFPLIFYMVVFRRDLGIQLLSIPLFLLVGECALATGSKGAYLSGAAGIASALLVGRSFLATLVIATVLVLAGSAASSMLPRMSSSGDMRNDEGIMGRAMAFEAARTAYETMPAGWNKFVASFQWLGETKQLATHSSIVQVGADQGPWGLFLYLSIMGCAARTLLTMKTESDNLERCRRLMFALFVCYFVSGWMINRSYSVEFFLISGAVAAYHKLARERILREHGWSPEAEAKEEADSELEEQLPVFRVGDGGQAVQLEQTTLTSLSRRIWNRYGVLDLAIGYALLSFTLWFWDYLIDYFKPV